MKIKICFRFVNLFADPRPDYGDQRRSTEPEIPRRQTPDAGNHGGRQVCRLPFSKEMTEIQFGTRNHPHFPGRGHVGVDNPVLTNTFAYQYQCGTSQIEIRVEERR